MYNKSFLYLTGIHRRLHARDKLFVQKIALQSNHTPYKATFLQLYNWWQYKLANSQFTMLRRAVLKSLNFCWIELKIIQEFRFTLCEHFCWWCWQYSTWSLFCLQKDSSTLPCSMVICQQYFCFTVAVYILFIHRLSSSCAEMISGWYQTLCIMAATVKSTPKLIIERLCSV